MGLVLLFYSRILQELKQVNIYAIFNNPKISTRRSKTLIFGSDMAKYLKSKQVGNKGEAFLESLISEYAITHKIDSSKDVGLDFLCEWVYGERPTQLLFGIQVKTRNNKNFKLIEEKSRLNLLQEYKSSFTIKKDTLNYWNGFDFPVFLFLINIQDKDINCFYKRYTPILHGKEKENDALFYKVNDKNKFLAFVRTENFCGGFCRDLFFDHLRCQHNKGMLSGVNPQDLGLSHWKADTLYRGVFDNYKKQIRSTFEKYKKFSHYFT